MRNRHLNTGTHAYQPRFIQLPPSVSEVLAETLQRRAEYTKSERWEKDCGLVFTTSVGTPVVEYRWFRHVVRNVYTHRFDPAKLGKLVNSAPELFARTKAELLAFAAFLEH